MATLADLLRSGYTPPTESPMADPIKQHIKNLPQKFEANTAEQMALLGQAFPGNTYESMMTEGDPKAMAELAMQVPTTGMFIGPNSPLWNKKAVFEAAKMEKQGIPAEEIWKITGSGRGLDNHWRQEISDADMVFDPVNVNKFRRMVEADTRHDPMKSSMELYNLVKHPKFQESYPESAQTTVFRGQSKGGGYASPNTWGEITLGVDPANRYISKAESIDEMASTLLHELQHNVQSAEGFAKGGNAGMFKEITPTKKQQKELDRLKSIYEPLEGGSPKRLSAIKDYYDLADQFKPHGQYSNLAGEAEARLTSRRRLLDDAARRQNYPFKRENPTGLDIDPNNALLIEEYGSPVISRREMLNKLLKDKK